MVSSLESLRKPVNTDSFADLMAQRIIGVAWAHPNGYREPARAAIRDILGTSDLGRAGEIIRENPDKARDLAHNYGYLIQQMDKAGE
jgi:hypothetical protein